MVNNPLITFLFFRFVYCDYIIAYFSEYVNNFLKTFLNNFFGTLLYNVETFHRDHLPYIKIGYMAGTGKPHKEHPFIPYYKKQTVVLSNG